MPKSPSPRLPSIPLLARVVLALAAVGILPFVVSVYQVQSGREAVIEQVQQTHLVSVVATADRVNGFIDLLRSLGRSTADHPVLRSNPTSEEALAHFTGMLEARPELIAAGLFLDPSDAATGRRPVPELVQMARAASESDAVSAIVDDLDARPLAVVTAAGARWLRLRVPVEGSDLFLLLVSEIAPIASALRPQEVGEAAEMVLWSPGLGAIIGTLSDGDAVPEPIRKLAAHAASAADTYILENGVSVVAAFAAVVDSPWLVVSRQPMAVAAHAATVQRRVAFRAFGLVFLVSGVIVFLAHRTIVKPIQAMLAVERGLGGSESPARGGEISQLRHAFERLTRSLHDREAMREVFLGRYRIIEVLGAGAMGTVFRAWDPRLERPVALKTVKIDLGHVESASDLADQLVREAVTLARLNHPNIVTVYDAASDGERAFLAMELVEGVSLERYIWQEKSLPIEQTVAVGIAVARALDAAHRRGVVHQDIKPANILLDKDGSIKVTDFGIAELLVRVRQDTNRTQICGTPGFLAPEVARGNASSEASDLFALGVVLYQGLTGRRPFSGATAQDVLVATVSMPHDDIEVARPETPSALVRLVNGLLAKEPGDRPQSARSVADTLTSLLAVGNVAEADVAWADAESPRLDSARIHLIPNRKRDDSTVDTHVLPAFDSAVSPPP